MVLEKLDRRVDVPLRDLEEAGGLAGRHSLAPAFENAWHQRMPRDAGHERVEFGAGLLVAFLLLPVVEDTVLCR
jgi:hypothetical protein